MSDGEVVVLALGSASPRAVVSGARVVTSVDAIDEVPRGVKWICAPSALDALRAARPDADVVVVRSLGAPWSALAHDVRGPLGVITGALEQLETDDPALPLARRASRQLAHLASCWEALSVPPRPRPVALDEVASAARRTFRTLEPRRGARVRLSGASERALSVDPERLELAIVRLLAHVTRLRREPVELAVDAGGFTLLGVTPEQVPGEAPRTSRLSLALRLLEPLGGRWEPADAGARWIGPGA